MPKHYFNQQFELINTEKMKRRARFIKRMQAKLKFKQGVKGINYTRKHHYFTD